MMQMAIWLALDDGDMEDMPPDVDEDDYTSPNSRTGRSSNPEKISKKKMSPLIGKDLYTLGLAELAEKDIVEVRALADHRRQKKSWLRECILASIQAIRNGMAIVIPPDNEMMPSWQKYVRSRPNNLDLK